MTAKDICEAYKTDVKARMGMKEILDTFVDPKSHDNYKDISYDEYDCSMELKHCKETIILKDEDLEKIWDMGFSLMWICYSDERGRGDPSYRDEAYADKLFKTRQRKNEWISNDLFYGNWYNFETDIYHLFSDKEFDNFDFTVDINPDELEVILKTKCKELPEKVKDVFLDMGFEKVSIKEL